ncbi:MAG: DUF2059 domain-containing protein [Pseudomonadota bacterium]
MRIIATVLLLLTFTTASAQDNDAEYYEMVDELLELTGALDIGEQLSALMVTEMTNALKRSSNDLPDKAYDLIAEEVNTAISESFASGEFQTMMYPVYANHLTKDDLVAMLAFYRTPSGKRIAKATPLMAQEGMLVGQKWGQSLGAGIGQRVVERLEAEGYEL